MFTAERVGALVGLDDDDGRRRAAIAGAAALAFLVFVGILYPAPLPVLALGLVLGSVSSLVAMGLVLIYRTNRIINFAQGDLGALAAVLAASLIVGPKWSFWPAVLTGLAVALLLGLLTEVLVVRRFAKAPRLLLSVATIGLLQLFAFGELALPRLFDYDTAPQPPVPFSFRHEWFPVVFNAGHLLILVVVPLVTAGLSTFFRVNRVGIALRAAAESSDRAELLGVPVKRLSTIAWVLAAGLSGLAVLLRLPIQGVSIGAVLGPSLLLRALAAAVIGRMENLPATFGAALVLGMMEQAVLFRTGRTIIVDGVLFFVILAALLVQRRRSTSRADDTGASSWTAIREVRPVPRELARLPEIRVTTAALAVVGGAMLLFAPLGMSSSRVNLLGVGLLLAIITCSLLVLTGWAGQISLGQLALVAIGAAVSGSLAQQGKNFFVCVAVGGLAGAAVAVVIGVPALRIRGPFLAVTTLAFAVTTGSFFLNAEFFPWLVPDGAQRIVRPVLFDKFDLESEHSLYYVLLTAFVLVAFSVRSLRRSRTGRVLVALRDNSRAAQAFGVDPVRAQLTAFGISGFMAAMAGALYVFHQHGLSATVLEPEQSLTVFSMAVIGGLGSVPGAVLGAAYLTFLTYSPFTREPLAQLLASGVGVLLILLLFPGGLGGLLYSARDRLLRAVARRRGLVVPSLLADVATDEAVAAPVRSQDAGRVDDPILRVTGLEVAYGRTQVLFGVDFEVGRNEIVALLGTNGAGKSTLLSAIAGLTKAQRGSIELDGSDVTRAGTGQMIEAGVVLVPGGKGVFPTLTVEENLRVASWPFHREPEHVREATDQVLEFFPVLRDRWHQKAGNLSGGEQQMLTLGQAFIARPRVLMIDELSLGLAPMIVEQLLGIVRAIHANGTAVVLVEQSVNVAVTVAERAVFMEKGMVRFNGVTADLLARPDLLRAVFLEGATGSAQGNGRGSALDAVRDRARFAARCDSCGREHGIAVEARALTARFGGVLAVDAVDLAVRSGQIVGLIGPNGAGKTTIFDLLSGFVPASGGRVFFGGVDVTDEAPHQRAARGLGRSFQDARLFPSMTVRQAIATALERHLAVRDPIAAALLSPAVRLAERSVQERVDELIDLLRLDAFADKFVGELSSGSRRIVDLACCLAHEPEVLLLDEPSSGLAQRETEALGPLLLEIRDRTGAGLVVVEHDMPLITAVADQLVALELGRVIATGAPEDVVRDPAVVRSYLGASEEVVRRSGGVVRRRKPRQKVRT